MAWHGVTARGYTRAHMSSATGGPPGVQLDLFSGAASDWCQRWSHRRQSWRHRSEDGGFDRDRYDVEPIEELVAKEFIESHHYSGTYPAARLRFGLHDRARDGQLVGVAVLSVPMQALVLTNAFPDLEPMTQSLELGRFCCLPVAPANSESFFLGRMFRLAREMGVRGIVSFSDPVVRTTTEGQIVHGGHIGTIYQATNAIYTGRSTPGRITLLRDGTVISNRSLSKVRRQERGRDYVERQLVAEGARPLEPGENPAEWLRQALVDVGARRLTHPGNHRYLFPIGSPTERRHTRIGFVATGYPKQVDAAPAPSLTFIAAPAGQRHPSPLSMPQPKGIPMPTVRTPTSDGKYAEIDAAVVDALVARLEQAAIAPEALDDTVHDCCDATASRRFNNDPSLPENADEALDVAYGDASKIGSDVNNDGLRAQVAFLIAELGPQGARQIIDGVLTKAVEAAATPSSALDLGITPLGGP
jgi:hypothetical protein